MISYLDNIIDKESGDLKVLVCFNKPNSEIQPLIAVEGERYISLVKIKTSRRDQSKEQAEGHDDSSQTPASSIAFNSSFT